MRIHCLENVDKALQFLKEQKVHLENMGSHDIVDGNHRLTLGLIWTIILRFQVTYKLVLLVCPLSPAATFLNLFQSASLVLRHLVSLCCRVHPQANSQKMVRGYCYWDVIYKAICHIDGHGITVITCEVFHR